MGHYARIDERAFSRGVDQALRLGPLSRVVRGVLTGKGKQPVESGLYADDEGKQSNTIVVRVNRAGRKQK